MKTEKQIRRRISKERESFNEAMGKARASKNLSKDQSFYYTTAAQFKGLLNLLKWVLDEDKKPPFGYTCDGRFIDAKGNVLEAEQKTNTNDMSLNDEPSAT